MSELEAQTHIRRVTIEETPPRSHAIKRASLGKSSLASTDSADQEISPVELSVSDHTLLTDLQLTHPKFVTFLNLRLGENFVEEYEKWLHNPDDQLQGSGLTKPKPVVVAQPILSQPEKDRIFDSWKYVLADMQKLSELDDDCWQEWMQVDEVSRKLHGLLSLDQRACWFSGLFYALICTMQNDGFEREMHLTTAGAYLLLWTQSKPPLTNFVFALQGAFAKHFDPKYPGVSNDWCKLCEAAFVEIIESDAVDSLGVLGTINVWRPKSGAWKGYTTRLTAYSLGIYDPKNKDLKIEINFVDEWEIERLSDPDIPAREFCFTLCLVDQEVALSVDTHEELDLWKKLLKIRIEMGFLRLELGATKKRKTRQNLDSILGKKTKFGGAGSSKTQDKITFRRNTLFERTEPDVTSNLLRAGLLSPRKELGFLRRTETVNKDPDSPITRPRAMDLHGAESPLKNKDLRDKEIVGSGKHAIKKDPQSNSKREYLTQPAQPGAASPPMTARKIQTDPPPQSQQPHQSATNAEAGKPTQTHLLSSFLATIQESITEARTISTFNVSGKIKLHTTGKDDPPIHGGTFEKLVLLSENEPTPNVPNSGNRSSWHGNESDKAADVRASPSEDFLTQDQKVKFAQVNKEPKGKKLPPVLEHSEIPQECVGPPRHSESVKKHRASGSRSPRGRKKINPHPSNEERDKQKISPAPSPTPHMADHNEPHSPIITPPPTGAGGDTREKGSGDSGGSSMTMVELSSNSGGHVDSLGRTILQVPEGHSYPSTSPPSVNASGSSSTSPASLGSSNSPVSAPNSASSTPKKASDQWKVSRLPAPTSAVAPRKVVEEQDLRQIPFGKRRSPDEHLVSPDPTARARAAGPGSGGVSPSGPLKRSDELPSNSRPHPELKPFTAPTRNQPPRRASQFAPPAELMQGRTSPPPDSHPPVRGLPNRLNSPFHKKPDPIDPTSQPSTAPDPDSLPRDYPFINLNGRELNFTHPHHGSPHVHQTLNGEDLSSVLLQPEETHQPRDVQFESIESEESDPWKTGNSDFETPFSSRPLSTILDSDSVPQFDDPDFDVSFEDPNPDTSDSAGSGKHELSVTGKRPPSVWDEEIYARKLVLLHQQKREKAEQELLSPGRQQHQEGSRQRQPSPNPENPSHGAVIHPRMNTEEFEVAAQNIMSLHHQRFQTRVPPAQIPDLPMSLGPESEGLPQEQSRVRSPTVERALSGGGDYPVTKVTGFKTPERDLSPNTRAQYRASLFGNSPSYLSTETSHAPGCESPKSPGGSPRRGGELKLSPKLVPSPNPSPTATVEKEHRVHRQKSRDPQDELHPPSPAHESGTSPTSPHSTGTPESSRPTFPVPKQPQQPNRFQSKFTHQPQEELLSWDNLFHNMDIGPAPDESTGSKNSAPSSPTLPHAGKKGRGLSAERKKDSPSGGKGVAAALIPRLSRMNEVFGGDKNHSADQNSERADAITPKTNLNLKSIPMSDNLEQHQEKKPITPKQSPRDRGRSELRTPKSRSPSREKKKNWKKRRNQ